MLGLGRLVSYLYRLGFRPIILSIAVSVRKGGDDGQRKDGTKGCMVYADSRLQSRQVGLTSGPDEWY